MTDPATNEDELVARVVAEVMRQVNVETGRLAADVAAGVATAMLTQRSVTVAPRVNA